MRQTGLGESAPDEILVQEAKADSDLPICLLIARYTPLVACKAKRMRGMGPELEDLMQEGMLGLLGAIRGYRPECGSSFHTYAGTCVSNRILSAVKAYHRNKNHPMNSYAPLEEAEESDLYLQNDPQELFIQQEEELLRQQQITNLLSTFEREVLSLYLGGCSYQETAQRMGCATKAVDNALQRVRRKLHD